MGAPATAGLAVVLAMSVFATAPAQAAHVQPLAATAAPGTPQLAPTKSVEQVRQLAQCGKRMYAVGTFSKISQGSTVYSRENAFSFSATAPYRVSRWHPKVNGEVNSIAFAGHDCSSAYLGGEFTRINKRHASNIVKVSTRTGTVRRRFKATANQPVETLLVWKKHLLVGGFFTSIDHRSSHKYFASLRLTNGKDDGYLSLRISGTYTFRNHNGRKSRGNPTRIYNQQLNPARTRLLVEGDFRKIGGKHREQIAMLQLRKKRVTTTGWHATEFNDHCAAYEPFYARAAAWSTNGKRVFVASTGSSPANGPGSIHTEPRADLCDSASAFPAARRRVTHDWVNYTGCDSLYSVAADPRTVYFAGHERWFNNPDQCNNNKSGKATDAPGIAGLSPSTGAVTYNPTRSRGYGADDLLVTKAGLWIASDNFDDSSMCAKMPDHAGICMLPRR